MKFTGRFAPSPTGPLHMGSLIAALASFCDIKQRGGQWFVRIDDLDPPREDPRARGRILDSLAAHGLQGDRPVDYQSEHHQRYADAFTRIHDDVFYCNCSRRSLARQAIYPGTCRARRAPAPDTAARLQVGSAQVLLDDARHGAHTYALGEDFGDFIVKRRDGLWAYNFATAVDDGLDATHVLRGDDLFHVTPLQVHVMQMLELTPPRYAHIPVLCFADGTKLSKQTHAPALRDDLAASNLREAYGYLGMQPPAEDWAVSQWLGWGVEQWRLDRVPQQLAPYRPA